MSTPFITQSQFEAHLNVYVKDHDRFEIGLRCVIVALLVISVALVALACYYLAIEQVTSLIIWRSITVLGAIALSGYVAVLTAGAFMDTLRGHLNLEERAKAMTLDLFKKVTTNSEPTSIIVKQEDESFYAHRSSNGVYRKEFYPKNYFPENEISFSSLSEEELTKRQRFL